MSLSYPGSMISFQVSWIIGQRGDRVGGRGGEAETKGKWEERDVGRRERCLVRAKDRRKQKEMHEERVTGDTERQDIETKGTKERRTQKETERGRKADHETERAGGKQGRERQGDEAGRAWACTRETAFQCLPSLESWPSTPPPSN